MKTEKKEASALAKVFAEILFNGKKWAEDYTRATGKSPWQKDTAKKAG